MILWRISNHLSLDGGGGLIADGRWHTCGRRIVYCSPNPATALLEVLVHTEIDTSDLPVRFQYLEIEVPDQTSIETVESIPADHVARSFGDEWLRSGRTALLRVSSVIVPATWNCLINPHHPESAAIKIQRAQHHAIDRRLGRR